MTDRAKCLRIWWRTNSLLFDIEEVISKYIDAVCDEIDPEDEDIDVALLDDPEEWFMGEMRRISEEKQRSEQSGSFSDAVDIALNLAGDKYVHDALFRLIRYGGKLLRRFPEECRLKSPAFEIWRFLNHLGNEAFFYLTFQNNVPQEELMAEKTITTPRESNEDKTKGRLAKNLKSCMLCANPETMLSKLHGLIDGKQGKVVALIIRACIKAGVMTKPTFKQVQDEFGDIGNRQGYNKYMNENYSFTVEEVEPIITIIREQ